MHVPLLHGVTVRVIFFENASVTKQLDWYFDHQIMIFSLKKWEIMKI